jgi:serine/threonine-protein kinase
LLATLAAAHTAGFIHRDIKPENIIITDGDQVKVTDFGLARALQAPGSATVGLLIGTAAYLAPEQVSGEGTDERTDVYQAGVLLYELLTGQAPFTGETSWAVANQHVTATVPPVTQLRPDCPPGVAALVAESTRRAPDRRFASAAEFRHRVAAERAHLPDPEPLPRRSAVIAADPPAPEPADGGARDPAGAADTAAAAPPRDNRPWRVGATLTLLAVLLAAALAWIATANPFDRTDVPDVVGSSEAAATAKLTGRGFTVAVTDRTFSEKRRAGEIISTDPEPGASARTGSEIGMVVSLGPERYEVPKVRGLTPVAAASTLAATNLAVAGERREYHDSIDRGLIVGTDPRRGTKVKRDAPITLLVSKGPAPVDVPDLSGASQAAATSQLDALGLRTRVSTRQSETVPKGSVIQTAPAAGTTVYRGDRVEIIVSEGPPPVTVPDVVDLPRDEAIQTLKAAGFDVEVSEGLVTPLDRVFQTDPAAGTLAPKGSTVTISIF